MKGSIQATGVPKSVAIPRLNRRGEMVFANIYFGSTFLHLPNVFCIPYLFFFQIGVLSITRESDAGRLDTIRHQFHCFNSAVTMAVAFYRFLLVCCCCFCFRCFFIILSATDT